MAQTNTATPAAPTAAAVPNAAPAARPAPAPASSNDAGDPYDVVVIGAGPGGYIAAFRAAQNGLRTAVIEREWVGGVCLNVGCIPSKALLRNAAVVRTIHDAKTYGVEVGEVKADYGMAVDRSRQVVARIVKGLEFLFRKHKVDLVRGEATLAAKDTISVTSQDGGKRDVKTKNVIIATGARPRLFPGMEVDGERVMHVWQLIVDRAKPERIVIVGGGVIGCEMATVFRSYGCEVTIVEAMDRLLGGREDPKITQLLQRSFEKQGMKLLTGAKVESAKRSGDVARIIYTKDGKQETIEADRCLIAVATQPNTENLGLDQLGVQLDRGYVKVDQKMATNVPGVWAIGDVANTPMGLAHVASAEGHLVADAIAGKIVHPLKYNDMPRPIFSHPQVAAVGLTEAQAKEQGYEVKIGEFPFSALGKAVAENDFEGVVRLVVDAKYGEILGCHIIGPEATELLSQVTPYKVLEGTSRELIDTVVSHPTLSESIKIAATVAEGESLEI
ncbi:MAG TPA: dihydrolipoyl dehydrogenase [Chloroflexota bacterium]|nr:dihydrolipoyl dehydrogenase [Chloroflexota bacterium]